MSITEAIQNKLCHPVFGLILMLLLSLQLQVGHSFYKVNHRQADTKKELQLEQSIDVTSTQGVLLEINLNFVAAVILILLFPVLLSVQKVKLSAAHFSPAARYWGCIVPKGP